MVCREGIIMDRQEKLDILKNLKTRTIDIGRSL